ncbi:META domain-containing protein [Colwellia sp. RSH04]|uniref:META domain-containing protein n=1 Tax=Colwellia sp. RSH04 TaxID=2305464 RepID=UPI000E586B2C|nr:META domain-containing protein [Colwellia sp. RSH04]RHW77277.1 META domain-containing protein [Colwellia sp. RSH04]
MKQHLSLITIIVTSSLLVACVSNQHQSLPSVSNEQVLLGQWQVIQLNDIGVLAQHSASLIFTDKNKLTGTTGCNNFHTNYTTNKEALSFSMLATTRKMCHEKLMKQESLFLQNLGAVNSYQIKDQQLLLLNNTGSTIFTAQKVYIK